jgi:hypothetical protein
MAIGSPIVIDLGKVRNADFNELFTGKGRLLEEVHEVMRLLKAAQESNNRILIPIVAAYDPAAPSDRHDNMSKKSE